MMWLCQCDRSTRPGIYDRIWSHQGSVHHSENFSIQEWDWMRLDVHQRLKPEELLSLSVISFTSSWFKNICPRKSSTSASLGYIMSITGWWWKIISNWARGDQHLHVRWNCQEKNSLWKILLRNCTLDLQINDDILYKYIIKWVYTTSCSLMEQF